MCGIAGYVGSREISEETIQKCLGLMRRRGPDQAAYEQFTNSAGKHVYLLFSRLAIIDLDERASQPFNVGQKAMVFNGEIYNYLEVRAGLGQRKETLKTESDTEVLLTAIDEFGWGALDQCEGMWALAVYDRADGSVTLSRDRFGEKPLYLYHDETGLYFGSEVKLITALLGRQLEVNTDHLFRYMVNGYKALYKGGQTFFKGLSELPAATYMRVDSVGQETCSTYWEPRYAPDEGMTYEQAVAGARERLIRAVELRLRADVPLAFCMSGGVDSNSLISIARRIFDYDVHGFTITNSDARYEEKDLIDLAVSELGIRHTAIPVETTEFLPRLRALVNYHDAPVYTITYYAHSMLQESIHEHGYRISLSGTAADELFSGYYDHHLAYLYEVQGDSVLHASSRKAWEQHIKPLVRNPFLGNPSLFIDQPGFRDHVYLEADEFATFLNTPWSEPFVEREFTDSLLRNRMLNEMFYEAVPVILHEDDLNAMYYSVENRSPFLDRDLFEFCYSIPSRHLIRDGRAKAVLRDAMRGIVPDPIIESRRKVGFNAPILDYLDVEDPEVRAYLLDDGPIYDYVRKEKIETLIGKTDLPNSQSKFLFYFLCSKMFLEEFA